MYVFIYSFDSMNIHEKSRAHSTIDNPNENWLDSKGAWLSYAIVVTFFHLALLSMPFFSTATVWTLTNVIHNVVSCWVLQIGGYHLQVVSMLSSKVII